MTTPREPYATTEALKARVRACTTTSHVDAAARAMAAEAKAHEASDPGGIAQLRNLITYQRTAITRGWLRQEQDEAPQ
ncbi:hypothetical protein PANO111632_02730 [Paracoccus nototheniae]|uniref:Uncharacterized protein n=1 Tax=Paracoccus nototheniae TaxID=2489002 RepID=A0ABW4DYA8_9RHOB|nr:hypothetical protein [Paracoccus nototheniae]